MVWLIVSGKDMQSGGARCPESPPKRAKSTAIKHLTALNHMAESAEFVTQITRAQRQLHAFILSMVWNPAEADDVLQETNLVLWEKSGEFDGSRPFLPWAMRFAQLQAMAWLKRRQRQQDRLVFDDELGQVARRRGGGGAGVRGPLARPGVLP